MRRLAYHLPSQIKPDLEMEAASRTVINLQSYVFQGDAPSAPFLEAMHNKIPSPSQEPVAMSFTRP
jgi:hypothetical protein